MTITSNNANAFASTFYFLLKHKPIQKNKKSLQANAPDNTKVQCKLDQTTLRTDRRAADNKGLAKVAVQCSTDTFAVHQSLFSASIFVVKIATFAKRQPLYKIVSFFVR